MSVFMIKALLRLIAILVAVAVIRWGIVIIWGTHADLLQILYAIGLLIAAIILALMINWFANRIPYNGSKKGK